MSEYYNGWSQARIEAHRERNREHQRRKSRKALGLPDRRSSAYRKNGLVAKGLAPRKDPKLTEEEILMKQAAAEAIAASAARLRARRRKRLLSNP